MSGKIKESLQKNFNSNRIIFWYDEKSELLEDYENLEDSEFTKIHVKRNEFEVKHIINKQFPDQKFLLYFNHTKPNNEDNWLLDMELAHHVFHTDQEAMFLQELGLGYHLKELVSDHIEFFKSKERRQKLKELLGEGDEHEELRGKMLAVTFNTEYVNLNTFIQAHGTAYIQNNEQLDKELLRFNLQDYYWGKIKTHFNYESEDPSIYDFLMEVFNSNFILGPKTALKRESKLLLSQWKDTLQYRDSFGLLSEKAAKDLAIEATLEHAELEKIIDDDLFKLTDYKVIHDLVKLLSEESMPFDKVGKLIKKRENKFWYPEFEHFYQTILFAAEFLLRVRKNPTTNYKSFQEGIQEYKDKGYEIDLYYRKFIWSFRETNQNSILAELDFKIEKVYSNDWLLRTNDHWQTKIDALKKWPTADLMSQRQFFKTHVKPFIDKKQRLFVIVSDALRYECGVELNERLLAANRYESSIEASVSSLPSYTQLGMASLLPHTEIQWQEKSDSVVVDGMSSSGIQGRSKILETNAGVRATAINADDLMSMNSTTEGREFVKKYDLIYIYHNRIDKTGDDKVSEEKVFDAVEEELTFLIDLLKKIANLNGNNMIITSDHGFIYQHNDLVESDFLKADIKGTVYKENRRFVIGENLEGPNSLLPFTGEQLGIHSKAGVLIPKSINRLRVKGAGSRFVHGGATLQEIVTPVLKVSKKRQDTTSYVDIDIIKSTDRITTNLLAVSFIQISLASDTILGRTLRAGIYAEDGAILSDLFTYNFDISEGSERQREVKHRFQLMGQASGKYKNQRVKLILEEPVEGTTKWKQYKEYYYTLNISFTNDFDDF